MRQDIINSGIEEHRVFTIPNLIHIPDQIQYREPRNNQIPTIGVCARFAAIKGVDVFINALAELKRRGIVFQAKIAGDGKEKEQYIKLIRHHGLDNEITLLGWIEDRESFYQSIDIFCLPSREESFGLVILESMMHSLPMVLTRLSGHLKLQVTQVVLFLFPPKILSAWLMGWNVSCEIKICQDNLRSKRFRECNITPAQKSLQFCIKFWRKYVTSINNKTSCTIL